MAEPDRYDAMAGDIAWSTPGVDPNGANGLHMKIAAALREAAASAWRPISGAPKDGPCKDILLLCNWRGRKVVVAHWAFGGGDEQPRFGPAWFYWTGYHFDELPRDAKPTHWMPLPAPPEPK